MSKANEMMEGAAISEIHERTAMTDGEKVGGGRPRCQESAKMVFGPDPVFFSKKPTHPPSLDGSLFFRSQINGLTMLALTRPAATRSPATGR
jgi:hypothetical protein